MLDFFKEVLNKRRSTAIVAAASIVVLYKFSKVPVPSIAENKLYFRIDYIFKGIIKLMANVGSKLNYGTEPAVFRSIFNHLTQVQKKNSLAPRKVNIIESQAQDVPLRIYFPKLGKDTLLPVMIYYHGGGYVFGSASDYDDFLVWIVENVPIIIVSVDYHLAPEYEYPIPIEECYIGTNYFIENLNEYDFNIDRNRIILCGHSAGANIATIIAGKIRQYDPTRIKLQILLNPPTQYFTFHLPSHMAYSYLDFPISRAKLALWHMGMSTVLDSHERVLDENQHTLLLDHASRVRYESYVDVELIGEQYKQGRFYDTRISQGREDYNKKLKEDSGVDLEKNFQSLLLNLFKTNVSPGLADDQKLKFQPKTYMMVCEFDSRKDEALIYAERMSRQGVWVDVAFYEDGFHASIMEDSRTGCQMRDDLISYLKINI